MPLVRDRLDLKDRRIVEVIAQDPKASIPLIAKLTGIPESTVAKRLSHLQQTNRIGRVLQVFDWVAAGYARRYRVDVMVDQRGLSKGEGGPYRKTREGEEIPGSEKICTQEQLARYIKYNLSKNYIGRIVVLDVSILLGSAADLTVVVCAKGRNAIREFVTNGLRPLGGIQNTATSEEVWTCPPLPELVPAAYQIDQVEGL